MSIDNSDTPYHAIPNVLLDKGACNTLICLFTSTGMSLPSCCETREKLPIPLHTTTTVIETLERGVNGVCVTISCICMCVASIRANHRKMKMLYPLECPQNSIRRCHRFLTAKKGGRRELNPLPLVP